MSIQPKTAGSGEVGVEPQSVWTLILAVLAMGILVVTSNLTIKGDFIEVVEFPERVVREFPGRPNLLEWERNVYFIRQAKQERALAAEAGRYSSLGQFYGVGPEVEEKQAESLLQVQ
jgi:hypothetical protein